MDGGEAPHAQLGLIQGFLPRRPTRGRCEIRGLRANLWGPVARALGFEVAQSRYRSTLLHDWLDAAGITPTRLSLDRFRVDERVPDVLFCDLDTLPASSSLAYWRDWAIPHVFFSPAAPPAAPNGWSFKAVDYSHSSLGGSTTATTWLTVWYPPGHTPHQPIRPPRQPWMPLRSCINRLNGGLAAVAPDEHALTEGVLHLPNSEVVRGEGLFPHSALNSTVVAPADLTPSG